MRVINIWCDGSCNNKTKNNGGVGVVIKEGRDIKVIFEGQFISTTSGAMEVYGLLLSLKSIKDKKGVRLRIHCDNKYVVDSIDKGWVFLWEVENWKNRANTELWKKVLKEYRKFPKDRVKLIWVKGHNDNPYNEIADRLAHIGAKSNDIIENL